MTPTSLSSTARGVHRVPFGYDVAGHAVELFTLRNSGGAEVEVLSLGGIIRAVRVPDRHGVLADVVLGFDDAASYQRGTLYLGALIGRYANRIARGAFTVDGVRYTLSRNDGDNTLHGGVDGFDRRVWQVEPFLHDEAVGAVLTCHSADGDMGFPGELAVTVTYTWRDDNTLAVEYGAHTTAATPVCLTQHSYFNLSGVPASTVLEQQLTIHASHITPVTPSLVPTGALQAVDGTPFDFREPRAIGARLNASDAQLAMGGGGYDHNWVLDGMPGTMRDVAMLYDAVSGRTLTIATTEPGLQVYSGNALADGRAGKGGVPLVNHGGVALETQHFPDSPNQPHFPSVIVRPGVPYLSRTAFRFGVE